MYGNGWDERLEKVMQYYEDHKKDILKTRKKFYQYNQDVILEERAKYYKENYKTKISDQMKTKEKCECGITVIHYIMKKTHADLMKKLNEEKDNKEEDTNKSKKAKCECGMTIKLTSMKKHKQKDMQKQ